MVHNLGILTSGSDERVLRTTGLNDNDESPSGQRWATKYVTLGQQPVNLTAKDGGLGRYWPRRRAGVPTTVSVAVRVWHIGYHGLKQRTCCKGEKKNY